MPGVVEPAAPSSASSAFGLLVGDVRRLRAVDRRGGRAPTRPGRTCPSPTSAGARCRRASRRGRSRAGRASRRTACCLPGAVGSVSDAAKLSPSIGLCSIALDRRRRRDAEQVVDRRHDVDRVDVLLARTSRRRRSCAGHETRHMSAMPPSYPAHRFQYGNGVSNAQRPAGVVVVVRLGPPSSSMCSRVSAVGVGHAVEEAPLVEGAVRAALAAGAVVGDHDDDRVVELPGLLEVVEHAADLVVGVRDVARRTPRPSGRRAASRRRSASPTAAPCRAAARAGRRGRSRRARRAG